MSDEGPVLKEKCLLVNDVKDYWFVSQGNLTVPFIADRVNMQFANDAFNVSKEFQISASLRGSY